MDVSRSRQGPRPVCVQEKGFWEHRRLEEVPPHPSSLHCLDSSMEGRTVTSVGGGFFRTLGRGSLLSPNLAPFSKLLPSQERDLDILSYSPKASKERGLPRGELANLGFESPETSILLGPCRAPVTTATTLRSLGLVVSLGGELRIPGS